MREQGVQHSTNRLERIVESVVPPQGTSIQVCYALPPSKEAPETRHHNRDVARQFVGKGVDSVFIDDRFAPQSALYLPKAVDGIFGYSTTLREGNPRRVLILSDTQIPLDPDQDVVSDDLRRFYDRFSTADQSLYPLPVIEGRKPEHWEIMEETMREKSRQLKQTRQQERVTTRRLRRLAYVDDNTELPNRRAYFSDGPGHIQRAIEQQEKIYVMTLDSIDFKPINDKLGQTGGDEALKQFGLLLLKSVREKDKLYRVGGDEFRVVTNADPDMIATRFQKVIPTTPIRVKDMNNRFVEVRFKGVHVGVGSYDGSRSGPMPLDQQLSIFAHITETADNAMKEEKERYKARLIRQ